MRGSQVRLLALGIAMGKLTLTIGAGNNLVKVLALHRARLAEVKKHVVTLQIANAELRQNQKRLERLHERCCMEHVDLRLKLKQQEILQDQEISSGRIISWQLRMLRGSFAFFEKQAECTSAKLSERLQLFLHGLNRLDLDNKVAVK